MNKVILMGRLVRNPEVRYGQGAEPLAVARYTLAVNRRFKRQGDTTGGSDASSSRSGRATQGDADFIPCVAFGKAGEFAEKYFKKGQLVSVIGRLQVRKWDDHGTTRWSTDVVVEEQYFAEGKAASESHGAAASNPPSNQKQTASANESGKQMDLSENDGFYPIEEGLEDDDLPF